MDGASAPATQALRQLTVRVPGEARPGCTRLRVTPRGDDFSLVLAVPAGAAAGDCLILEEGPDGEWSCRLQSQQQVAPGQHSAADDGKAAAFVTEGAPGPRSAVNGGKAAAPLTEPLTVCLAHVPVDAATCFEGLVDAARSGGAFVSPKLERGAALAVPGLVAREAIFQGEVLVRVPAGLHISPETCSQVFPELCAKVEAVSSIAEGRRTEAAQTACVAALLRAAVLRLEEQEGVVSRPAHKEPRWRAPPLWHRYAEALLGENFEGHPYWRSLKEPAKLKACLEPSGEAEYSRIMAGDAIAIYELITEAVHPDLLDPHFDVGLFLQSRMCLLTREFGTPRGSALVPVVDFCNHSPNPGAHQRWSFEEDAMIVIALRAHEAGEEVCITYGSLSAPLLFRTYGFVLPPQVEPNWTFACQASELSEVCKELGSASGFGRPAVLMAERFPPLAEVHFDARTVTPSLATALDACASGGGDAEALLREFCARRVALYEGDPGVERALASLRRAREVDPRSAAWWVASRRDTGDAAEAGAGLEEEQALWVKMSEYLCLTAHFEALDLAAGRSLQEERCLAPAGNLSRELSRWRHAPEAFGV